MDAGDDLAVSQVLPRDDLGLDLDRQVDEKKLDAVDFMKVSQMEVTMTRQQILVAFYDLEKTRLRQIEQLIPHFQQLRHNHKDK